MSMHIEWASTGEGIWILNNAEAEEELAHPTLQFEGEYVIVLGGNGGGCLAIEGKADDLLADLESWADELRQRIVRDRT